MKKVLILAAILSVLLGSCVMAQTVAPWGMTNANLGGTALNEYTPGVENGIGPHNVGLLVKTWGKVTYRNVTQKFFYIDDGSGLTDGSGYTGIRVSYNNLASGNNISAPTVGHYLTITGISSVITINGKIRPNLLPRDQSDIVSYGAQ
ncbi:MAG: hypothetical protein SNJ70_08855 [Armatimonadota bacterium]